MSKYNNGTERPHIVIVGAGAAGIAAGIRLKTDLKFYNFTIYEKSDGVSGTWKRNTYPGCGSDITGHWYSLSTDLNPWWDSFYASQPELKEYWEKLWYKYDLERHTELNTIVKSSTWDDAKQRYDVVIQNAKTGQEEIVHANIVFYALGGYQAAKFPDIPGLEKFKGDFFHSAEWNHNLSLKNKRVVVIGNGCSAAQFVPEISKDPSVQVTNFARSTQWYAPKGNYYYPWIVKAIFAYVPGVLRAYRASIFAKTDMSVTMFRKDNRLTVWFMKFILTAYMKWTAPKKYIDKLLPDYAPGCKRIIVDPDFLASLHRPNVDMRWDPIESFTEQGIKLKGGEIVPADVIIFGTGYSMELADLNVRGKNGDSILDYFKSKGGAQAYLGLAYPGFPNLYTFLGPNVITGHASVIFSHEAQTTQIIQLVKPVLDGLAKSVEVTEKATDEYNDWVHKRIAGSVWTECNSFYQVDGQAQSKNVVTFPGPVTYFWWMCRKPVWSRFNIVDGKAFEQKLRNDRLKNLLLAFVTVAVTVVVVQSNTELIKLGLDLVRQKIFA